jgi:hypothetical protein
VRSPSHPMFWRLLPPRSAMFQGLFLLGMNDIAWAAPRAARLVWVPTPECCLCGSGCPRSQRRPGCRCCCRSRPARTGGRGSRRRSCRCRVIEVAAVPHQPGRVAWGGMGSRCRGCQMRALGVPVRSQRAASMRSGCRRGRGRNCLRKE